MRSNRVNSFMQSLLQKVSFYLCLCPMNMKIKWYSLQQWLHKRIHP